MKRIILITLVIFISCRVVAQGNHLIQNYHKFKGLALTPPMGWNSWNKFACNIDERTIKAVADAIVTSGMKDAGYVYINLDDCWHGDRDSLGFIHADPVRFPSGIKALADYIHNKGLKIGIYSDAGSQTCGGRPGSRGYEFQDALTYASWGIDYLKYDWCNTESLNTEGAYKTMMAALRKAGRPTVFSICEWGNSKPWEWATPIGNMWRTTGDIYNCFDCMVDHGTWKSSGVMQILEQQDSLRKYAGPGHWNDPDMLEVGNGMPSNEDRAHFSMWCMIAAPLIAGNDPRDMSDQTLNILTNAEAISVDQDSLGIQGFKYQVRDSIETWLKPLKNGNWAVCFLNRARSSRKINFNWKEEVICDNLSNRTLDAKKITYQIKNIWTKTNLGDTRNRLNQVIAAHDVLMLKIIPLL